MLSTASLPEVREKRGADVEFQAVVAHLTDQQLQVSPRVASAWKCESVRKSVSLHQDKNRGSPIHRRKNEPRTENALGTRPAEL